MPTARPRRKAARRVRRHRRSFWSTPGSTGGTGRGRRSPSDFGSPLIGSCTTSWRSGLIRSGPSRPRCVCLVATASVLDSARGLDSTLPSPFSPFQTLVPGQENTLRNNVALRGNFGPSGMVVTGPNGGRIVVRPNGPVFFGNDQLVKRSGFWWE